MGLLRHPIIKLVGLVGITVGCVRAGVEAYDVGFMWMYAAFLAGVLWAVAVHALTDDD